MKRVIVFTSATCGPCKVVKPHVLKRGAEWNFMVTLVPADPHSAELFAQHQVRAVPTVICVDGDKEVGRFVGAMTPTQIDGKLREWGL